MITVATTELWSSVVLQETSPRHLVTLPLLDEVAPRHYRRLSPSCGRALPTSRASPILGAPFFEYQALPAYFTQKPGPKAVDIDRGENFVYRRHLRIACFMVFSSLVNYLLHVFDPQLLNSLRLDYMVMRDSIMREPASGSAEDWCLGLKWGRVVSEIRIPFPFSVVRINQSDVPDVIHPKMLSLKVWWGGVQPDRRISSLAAL
jgi:hypothetical protein